MYLALVQHTPGPRSPAQHMSVSRFGIDPCGCETLENYGMNLSNFDAVTSSNARRIYEQVLASSYFDIEDRYYSQSVG